MLDYRYYTFLAVASERSYTLAAEKLNLTQPAVTQQIRHLQEKLGFKLFYFKGKQLLLTEKGKYLQKQLFLLDQDIQQIQRHLQQTSDTETLTFGATLSIGEYAAPAVIADYLTAYPENHLDMVVGNTENLIEQVELGKLDFALIEGNFNQSKLGFQKFAEEHFIAVCAKESALWKEKQTIADLFTTQLFIREKGSGSRLIFEDLLRSKGASLDSFSKHTVFGNIGAVKQLVADNLGISFMYRIAVQEELQSGSLKQITVKGFSIFHPFHAVYLKKNREIKKIKEFIQFY